MKDAWDFGFGKGVAKQLVCWPEKLEYDFVAHVGTLRLIAGGCCDMDGCIQLFETLDPEVRRINTYSGAEADTIYRKHQTEWKSYDPIKT